MAKDFEFFTQSALVFYTLIRNTELAPYILYIDMKVIMTPSRSYQFTEGTKFKHMKLKYL